MTAPSGPEMPASPRKLSPLKHGQNESTPSEWWVPDSFRGVGAGFCTLAVFVILGVWLIVVARTVGIPPMLDGKGNVIFDEFGNAEDILLATLTLATTSLGYWYGNQGAATAKDDAATSGDVAAQATDEAVSARKQLTAVLDVTPPGALGNAKDAHPDAFE